MPVSDQSIIAPQELNAKPPIKKSTIGWLVGLALAVAALGVIAPMMFSSATPAAVDQPAKSASIDPGDPSQIDRELGDAKSKVQAPAAPVPALPASGALPPGTPLPPPGPVVPARARRDDASGALYAQTLDPAVAVEMDAAARQSTSLKFDASAGDTKPAADSVATRLLQLAPPADQQPTRAPENDGDRARERLLSAAADSARGPQPTTGGTVDRAWLREIGNALGARATPALKPYQVRHPYTLSQGKVIPAVLTRELNSDLPGLVTACTTMPVYDSLTGDHMLIPRGSCLIGQYSSAVATGQERILFAFTRLMLPDGTSVDLPGAPGADHAGAAGITGSVNNHFFKMFTTSLLVALLADRSEKGKTIVQSGNGTNGPATAAGQVLVDVSRSILERNRSIPPTITVAKGTRINVEVTRDIEFDGAFSPRNLR